MLLTFVQQYQKDSLCNRCGVGVSHIYELKDKILKNKQTHYVKKFKVILKDKA